MSEATGQASDGRAGITAQLVRRLLATQFPAWAGLPVVPVPVDGWDNRTYRLGDSWTVRLPTHARYVAGIAKEDRWLPVLADHLPLRVPVPVATGRPAQGFPYPWSVRRWIDGRPVTLEGVRDLPGLARDLALFLQALRSVDATDGPVAGGHSFYRGCPLGHYDAEVRAALSELGDTVDRVGVTRVWERALSSAWSGPPVWFHGDVAVGNLLLDSAGRLGAVLDFGTCGVGDPACDLVIAWTFFSADARRVFRRSVGLDDDTWARARGWALWKALIGLAAPGGTEQHYAQNQRVVEQVLTDQREGD